MASVAVVLASACAPKAEEAKPAAQAAAPAVAAPAQVAATPAVQTDPVEVVRAIYGPYLIKGGTPPLTNDVAPWTDSLRAELGKVNQSKDEVYFDYDPIIAAQDWELTNFNVTADAPPADGKASVTAAFTNIDRAEKVTYSLVQVDGVWKVDDLKSSAGGLRADLARAIAEEAKAVKQKH